MIVLGYVAFIVCSIHSISCMYRNFCKSQGESIGSFLGKIVGTIVVACSPIFIGLTLLILMELYAEMHSQT